MKRMIGFALASGLALLLAGCSSQSTGGSESFPAGAGQTGSEATRTSVPAAARNFNLAVKCPGVHWEKTHGWTDQQIMEHETVEQDDIAACEAWVKAQPKGYVPPPPGGSQTAAEKPASGAAPAKQ
jgi:PBP1b-binding outer membrane lipoprotein LpoB